MIKFREFELNCECYELRRNGRPVKLEKMPMELLILLASKNGHLVTRREITKCLWGSEVFVDSEHGINTVVRKLRQALRDDPDKPRFVETVTGKGYRFVVQSIEVDPPAVVQHQDPPATINPVPNGEDKKDERRKRLSAWLLPDSGSKKVGAWVLTGCVALALGGAAANWYQQHHPPPPLRVTGYNQITHDGHGGVIKGTDGARIYFNHLPKSSAVQVVSVSGGEIAKVPLGLGNMWMWDVSRDGSNLLVVSRSEPNALWTVGVLGGPAHFITNVENGWDHRWSPDGKYIAYIDEHGGLSVMGRDGSDKHKLVTEKTHIGDLAWSPDGGRIRFTDNDTLWEVSSAGTNLHPVFPNWKGPAGQCCGEWTPDGNIYLFLAGGKSLAPYAGNLEQIWALDERHRFLSPASPDPVQLTFSPLLWERPVPSKDGNKIFALGTLSRGELVRLDQTSKQLRPFLDGISAEFVAYSKDGAQVAYVTFPDGTLWRAKADGTERIQLTNPPLYPVLCRWSPDGSQILFTANRDPTAQPDPSRAALYAQPDPSRAALYVMPAQGGTPRLLVSGDDGQNQGDGVWSPDGRRVSYNTSPKYSLRVLDLDSGNVGEIPGSNGLYSPRWSPDGRYLAAMTRSSPMTIKLLDLQTQQWSTLVEHRGGWGWPTWSHNGKFLYAINEYAPNEVAVYRIPVPRGTPQLVVDLKDFRFAGVLNWFGLDPDDTPLLLRDYTTKDIYALTVEK